MTTVPTIQAEMAAPVGRATWASTSRAEGPWVPTTAMKARPIPVDAEIPEVLAAALGNLHNTSPFDVTGNPALSVPCGMSDGLPIVKIAVNISARQFNEPRDFADDITRLLNAVGLDPRYLELEMTESMLLKNVDQNIAVLKKLGKLGTSLAVDDFGTGYSSLAYLKQLPIDTLKIDRTFVRDIESDQDDAAIIKAIIAMAHGLDLRVTAEGVETQGQLSELRKLRCDQFQGYLLSRPLDGPALTDWVHGRAVNASAD